MNSTNSQNTSLELLARLGEGGHRVFSSEEAQQLLPNPSPKYVNQILHHLSRGGWLQRLRRGLYALSPDKFQGSPLHEFELAMALVRPAAISHWSALSVHGLTDQLPREVVVLTTDEVSRPRTHSSSGLLEIRGTRFRFCRVSPGHFFGVQTVWRGEAAITVTDPERTLLDGLTRPQLCGDFAVVWEAFQQHRPELDLPKIAEYSQNLGVTTVKRLGWVLERLGVDHSVVQELADVPIRGYRPLDPRGPRLGVCNSRWNIIENLPGGFR